mgnify:CR=1 FL=1
MRALTRRRPSESSRAVVWARAWAGRLRRRLWLRGHMTLILIAVFGVGIATHVATASLGAQLALRLGLAVTAAYAAFFVLVRLWLWAVAETRQPDVDPVSEVAEDSVDVAVDGLLDGPSSARHAVDLDGPSGGGGGDGTGLDGLDALDGLGELPVLLILGLVLGLIIGAVLLVWNAPAILGEAAFELALVTMLGPRARALDRPGWTGSVLRATALPYVLMLVVAVGVGLGAHAYCPEALRLRDVLHCGG